MAPHSNPRLIASLLAALIWSCGEAPVPDLGEVIAEVRVTAPASALAVGADMELAAAAFDGAGEAVPGATFSWTVDAPSRATISAAGPTAMLRGVDPGVVTVRATSSGIAGTSTVTITEATPVSVASLSIAPAAASIVQGGSAQLIATARDAAGNVLIGREVTWATSGAGTVTVDLAGVVTAVGPGSATITARCEGIEATARITVSATAIATISVSPTSGSIAGTGTLQLVATARDAAGNVLGDRFVSWRSDDNGVARVSMSGLVTGVAPGTVSIWAEAEGKAATASITVTQVPVATVTVTPATASVALGQSVQLTPTIRDAAGNVLAGRVVTWSSSAAGVATVSGSGLVRAGSAGSVTITATSEGRSGTAQVTVSTVAVASVSVSPTSVSLNPGQTRQLTATTRDAAGNVLTGRSVTWSSSATGIATVSSSGLVNAAGVGSATITATSEGRSGTAQVTVSTVPVASVSVSPTSVSLNPGQTHQLTATMRDATGNVLTGRSVTWSSSATGVATVSSSGLVTATGVGSATITATSEGRSGTAQVTVSTVPVASVSVSHTSVSLNPGQTRQLTATTRDAAGNVLTGRTVTWGSSATGVATVSGSGLVTAVSVGSATITATSEGRSGTAQVTVSTVAVASVSVSPTSVSLNPGQTRQLTATTRDAAGNVLTGRTVTWGSSATGVATVSSSGLVTAVSVGSATITATSEGRSGTASAAVVPVSGSANYALRFYANVLNDLGRVKIRVDDPSNTLPGPPADIGATDITIEFWIRGALAQNGAGPVTCGANVAWINGNIVLDRDRFTSGAGGRDYGISLAAGRVVFGIATSGAEYTVCGTTSVLDDQWHHVAVTRRASSGVMTLFVDGAQQAQVTGPAGDISYPDDAVPANNCNGSCAFSDPFLVLGAEKHDVLSPAAGFNGFLDELRLSTTIRYSSSFVRPTRRFEPDGLTAALYHFDEGNGTTLGDSSGSPGGPSNGTLRVGGSPSGPAWVTSGAPTGQ